MRRVEWGPVLLLAGYLVVVPPAFVLGPLAGLLLLCRPRTAREWIWIVVTGGGSLLWLERPGDLAAQVIRAAAVLLTGAYLVLTLWRPSASLARAVQAVVLAGAALTVLLARAGIGWTQLQRAVAHDVRTRLPALAGPAAVLFPALLVLISIVGVQLAWLWHQRLAEQPLKEWRLDS